MIIVASDSTFTCKLMEVNKIILIMTIIFDFSFRDQPHKKKLC